MDNLHNAVVVCATELTMHQESAVNLLVDEIEKRTRIRLTRVNSWPTHAAPTVFVGTRSHFEHLGQLPGLSLGAENLDGPEGYRICTLVKDGAPVVLVIGNDTRGMLYGVGY